MTIFFVAVLSAILEITAVPYASVRAAGFDLPLIVLIFFSLKKGFKFGAGLGVFFGVFNGFFSGISLWLSILLYGLTGVVVGYIGEWFYKERLPTFLFMIFCSAIFIYFSRYLYALIYFKTQLGAMDYIVRLFLPQAVYTTGASVFLYYFFRKIKV